MSAGLGEVITLALPLSFAPMSIDDLDQFVVKKLRFVNPDHFGVR